MREISLKEWLQQLASELKEAAPGVAGWNGCRATVQVQVRRHSSGSGFAVVETSSLPVPPQKNRGKSKSTPAPPSSSLHTITLELQWGGPPAPVPAASISSVAPAQTPAPSHASPQLHANLNEQDALALRDFLSPIIGAPGFDSSSRATVFREAIADHSHQDVITVLEALHKDGVPVSDTRLRTVQHKLNGILRTGPLKSRARGAELLLQKLKEIHLSAFDAVLLTFWKSQDDWL